MVRVYDLSAERVRVDATTISGYHQESEDGLFQFGKSKDNPELLQVKLMMASLDPLGLPIATDVVSGEKADDGLYVPIIDRLALTLNKTGLLFVEDCKMSAWATRVHIRAMGNHYLVPLSLVGEAPFSPFAPFPPLQEAVDGKQVLSPICAPGASANEKPLFVGAGLAPARGRACTPPK